MLKALSVSPIFAFVFALAIVACSAQPAPTLPQTPTTERIPYEISLSSATQADLATLDLPTQYSLTLRYDPATLTLAGNQQVRFSNRTGAPLSQIYFRLFANTPDGGGKISVNKVGVDGAPAQTTLEAQNTALQVQLAAPLAPRASADFSLEYSISVPRNNSRHYADFTADDVIITLPTVYPIIPAYDAKGWHVALSPAHGDFVYADASLYAITVTVPSTMTVIASGSTLATQTNADGTTTWRIVGAPMRDFNLNFAIGFEKSSVQVGETSLHSWYEPRDADAGKRALEIAADALRTFEKRVGAYPYRDLDIIETPTTAGGIEYPGVAVIARSLYRDAKNRDFFEFVIAHEVAHQWFYGVVGNDQVNEPWVDEALVQYLTLIYYEDVKGDGAAQTILRDFFLAPYRRAKGAGQDKPVNLPVRAYTEQQYSDIVYGKGPLFFDAIRKQMGDALFFKFLQTYFARYRYKIATGDDLLKTAEEVFGKSLRAEFEQWIAK